MSIALSHDLHEAVKAYGTPLEMIDSSTGEKYVLVPQATFARAKSLLDADATISRLQIPNAKLVELANRSLPPPEWYAGDEEELF
jgi:hypothetical protein